MDFKNIQEKITNFLEKALEMLQKYCTLIVKTDDRANYYIIKRAKMLLFIVIVAIFIIIARLWQLSGKNIYKHKTYNVERGNTFTRMDILDRNGETLVNSVNVYDLYLQSSRMGDIYSNIQKIKKILPNSIKNEQEIIQKLNDRKENNKIVFIKSGLTIKQRQQLLDADIEGMFFENAERRFYRNKSTNGITGYCPSAKQCISGIEKSMSSYITTKDNEPLKLSIDITLQNILRETLQKRVEETNSRGAVGIIMKIKTGELLGAVSLPDCDYNEYSACSNEDLFNRYSLGVYELGSVFKLFSVGLALRSGISPYKAYDRKAYKIDDDFTIHDLDKKEEKGGTLNLIEMTQISSNVGFTKLMEDIDIKNQISFLSNLGLLKKTQTEIPEIGTPIYPKKWTFTNAITISYGHGIAVSPLQYVVALASLLNNSPVRATFLKTDDVEKYDYKYLDNEKYEVFKDIMRQVVNSGGGRGAYIDEYDIGGKTGTAIQIKNGKYDKYSMVLSFVVALPMNNPQYVVFLMLDRPKADAQNNSLVRSSYILGRTMKELVSIIGPILNVEKI